MQNIAVVGLGSISDRHRKNLIEMYPSAIIHAISSSGKLKGRIIKNSHFTHINKQSLAGITLDFVLICSPATFHLEDIIFFSKKNIPIFVEKPLFSDHQLDSIDAKYLLKIKNKVALGYCLRFLPSLLKFKSIIDSKELGKIINIKTSAGQLLSDWRPLKNMNQVVSSSKKLGGGVLLELSHEIDYLQWIFGSLKLEKSILRNTKILDLDVEDVADLLATTKNNAVVNIHLDLLSARPHRFCKVICEGGDLLWNYIDQTITLYKKENIEIIFKGEVDDTNKMYKYMLKNFLLSSNTSPFKGANIQNGIDVLKFIQDAR